MTPISSALNQPLAPSVQHSHDDGSDFFSNEEHYNYNTLEPEARVLVRQRTTEIKALMCRTAQDIANIGQKLIEVKQELGHGNFRNWLKSEFDWSVSAATKFVQVGQQFKCVNFTHLDIAPSALYLLASPSISVAARQEALERADAGERITLAETKTIIGKYKDPAKPKVPEAAAIHDSSQTVAYQPSSTATTTQLVVVPSQPSQVDEEENEVDSEEVDQDYSANYNDAMRSQPLMDWQEGDFCRWQGKAGQILEIQGDEAIVDFFPPENVRTVRLADLQLPDLDQNPDSTDASEGENAALNAKEDNVIDEEHSEIQVMSTTPILNEPVNTINDNQLKSVEHKPIYGNGTKATSDELTIDVDAVAVEPKADDNPSDTPKYSALSQAYANIVSLGAEYSDKPLEHMTFREVDELLKQIMYDLNFSCVTGADYFSDDQIAEIWRAIAPRALKFQHWSNVELENFINEAVKELNSRQIT